MLSSNIVIFRLICDWHSNVKFFELMVNVLLCLGLSVAICLIFFCISNGAPSLRRQWTRNVHFVLVLKVSSNSSGL